MNWVVMEYIWESIWQHIEHFDAEHWKWVGWLLYPFTISFLLPLIIPLFFYCCVIFLHVYQYRGRLHETYARNFWKGARNTIAVLWEAQGRIWHGFRLLCEVFCVTPNTVQSCVEILREGHILGIAPGGVWEALVGDEYYRTMWDNRTGFAKVAVQTKVPIIPMFTRTPAWCSNTLQWLYKKFHLPIVPIYGLFPVKIVTCFGDAIYAENSMTAEELVNKVKLSIEDLIHRNQIVPGNILLGLSERVFWKENVA